MALGQPRPKKANPAVTHVPRHCWIVLLKPSAAVPTYMVLSLSRNEPQPCCTNLGDAEQSTDGANG